MLRACFLMRLWCSLMILNLARRRSNGATKSFGGTAATSHFNLLSTSISQPCKVRRKETSSVITSVCLSLWRSLTVSSSSVIDQSVYCTSAFGDSGLDWRILEAIKRHTEPRSCSWVLFILTTARKRSRRFIASGNTSRSQRSSSHTCTHGRTK